jgi:hypothetical protein
MKKAMPAGRQGSALILIVFIIAAFTILAALFAKIVYNNYASANAALLREQAFYLAEAGLEKGKVELVHNSNWYTDLPYFLEDNVTWLAGYALGQETTLGEGAFKIVREKGETNLYAIGKKGKGVVILRIDFSPAPFRILGWKEL